MEVRPQAIYWLFIVDNGTETDCFAFHSAAADAAVGAAELTLVARVHYDTATTTTALADYTFAA